MPMKMTTKPVEVEAVRFDGTNVDEVLAFCPHATWDRPELTIDHAEDDFEHVPVGSWVVRIARDGTFHVREHAYVEEHYRAVSQEPIADWPKEALLRDESVPEPGGGRGWIQWKGTAVCMDVHCRCGAHGHVDAEFAYFYRCAACGETFTVGQTVRLYPMTPEAAAKHGDRAVTADIIRDADGGLR